MAAAAPHARTCFHAISRNEQATPEIRRKNAFPYAWKQNFWLRTKILSCQKIRPVPQTTWATHHRRGRCPTPRMTGAKLPAGTIYPAGTTYTAGPARRVSDPYPTLTAYPSRLHPRIRSWIYGTALSLGMRSCSIESRSRIVTVPSSRVSPSTVMQNGVPASSIRR